MELLMAPRWSRTMTWLAVAAGAWSLSLVVTVGAGRLAGIEAPTCMMKRVTGLPCPTCGMTRGGLCILRGHVLEGWLHNPLMFTVAVAAAAVGVLRVGLGRRVRLVLGRRERLAAIGALASALAANWAYVICRVG